MRTIGARCEQRVRAGSGNEPGGDRFQHAVTDPRSIEIVHALEIIDIEQEHRNRLARIAAERRAKPGEKPMAPGDAGQLIGRVLQAVVALGRHHLMQRGDHTEDRPVVTDPWARADDPMAQPAGAVALDAVAALGSFAGEGSTLQFGDLKPAQKIELIMLPPGQRHRGEAKSGDPGGIRGDVAQLAIEHRDAGRNFIDELLYPVRLKRFGLAVDAGCHGRAIVEANPRLSLARLKKHELARTISASGNIKYRYA